MFPMISLESHRIRDPNSQIRNDRQDLVCPQTLESEIMRDFMNGEKSILIQCSSKYIGGEDKWEGKGVVGTHVDRDRELGSEDSED